MTAPSAGDDDIGEEEDATVRGGGGPLFSFVVGSAATAFLSFLRSEESGVKQARPFPTTALVCHSSSGKDKAVIHSATEAWTFSKPCYFYSLAYILLQDYNDKMCGLSQLNNLIILFLRAAPYINVRAGSKIPLLQEKLIFILPLNLNHRHRPHHDPWA